MTVFFFSVFSAVVKMSHETATTDLLPLAELWFQIKQLYGLEKVFMVSEHAPSCIPHPRPQRRMETKNVRF